MHSSHMYAYALVSGAADATADDAHGFDGARSQDYVTRRPSHTSITDNVARRLDAEGASQKTGNELVNAPT